MQDKSKELVEKIISIHSSVLRWGVKNTGDFFDINGKKPHMLTRAQMEYLKTIESLERATISQLEKILYVSKSSISITVSKLVKEGYVRRYKCEDESDGRKIFLELTPEGTKALNEVNERVAERFARFYETLDEERKKDLQTAIDSVYKLFDNKED